MSAPKSRRLSKTRSLVFQRVKTSSERQTTPQPRPAKKCESMRASPRPYTELGRRSIFDMIQVTRRVYEQGDGLAHERAAQGYFRAGLRLRRGRRVQSVVDHPRAVQKGSHEGDEDEQAPAG